MGGEGIHLFHCVPACVVGNVLFGFGTKTVRIRPERSQDLHHHVEHEGHPARPDHTERAIKVKHDCFGSS